MRQIVGFIVANTAYFLIGLTALYLLLLINVAILSRKIARITNKRSVQIQEGSVGEIADCLQSHSEMLSAMKEQINSIITKQSDQAQRLDSCLQRVGVIRFDAFEDVGGEQSFAVALLDANKNGIVISNLYGRQDSRVYAKQVIGGECERALSDEEKKALDSALT